MMRCAFCDERVEAERSGPEPTDYDLIDGADHCDLCTSFFCAACAREHELLGCDGFWRLVG